MVTTDRLSSNECNLGALFNADPTLKSIVNQLGARRPLQMSPRHKETCRPAFTRRRAAVTALKSLIVIRNWTAAGRASLQSIQRKTRRRVAAAGLTELLSAHRRSQDFCCGGALCCCLKC